MFAPATQPQQQQKQNQSEHVSSAEEEALKWNTDCVYFLASPLTCKKGAECEYRHSEYARVNPRDCYYWLNGNCMNPKCGFRHPPLEGLLGNQGGAPAGPGPVQPSHATPHPSVAKQPVPCVFFQKGMCAKGDMCSFLHTPNPAAYKKPHPVEAKPASDPQFSKKPIENNTGEKKFPDANLSKTVKANVDIVAAPRVASAGLRDSRGPEGYIPKQVGYEPVMQKQSTGVPPFAERGHSTQYLQKYGSDDNNSFHNGNNADDVLRESSPGFDVLVDNEARDSEYYNVEDRYGRRSQEGGNAVNEYDPDFSAIADGDNEPFRDQRFDSYDQREDRYAWGHRRVSSERGDPSERRVYTEDERPENMLESDLRYRLAKQRKVNGVRSVGSHDFAAPEPSVERGYRDSRRDIPRESSISSSRLQGRIKLHERSNGDEGHHLDRRSERGRDRSELSSQGRLRDRIKSRLDENNQERGLRALWARRREIEDERKSAPKSILDFKTSKKEESTTEPSLGKRKSLEEDHHSHKRSGNSFAAPLPFSEILKRKRAAAAGGSSSNNKEEEAISKKEAEDETKLITEEKIEVVAEPKPTNEAEIEAGGTIMEEEVVGEEVYEGNEEEQAYEGDENGEYYYEEGYEEEGDYVYEEGENAEGEEVAYTAEEGEEATEGGEAEVEEDIENKTVEMLS